MNITTFAETLTKEIYETWKTKYAFWKYGIKVFYAPVIEKPKLMIISLQPGGGEVDFLKEDKGNFENGDFSITGNAYVDTNYTMARKVRGFFDFDPQYTLLKESVIFPLIFFRAPSIQVWDKELSPNKRQEMENFCFEKTREIINVVNPEKILIIGLKTYKKVKELLGEVENEKIIHTRGTKFDTVAITAEYKNKKIFAVMHFSGAHISRTDWATVKELFKQWV